MKWFSIAALVAALLLSSSVLGAIPVPANGPSQANTSTTLFLPVVASGYISRPPCSPDSPFSIQIAALHMLPGQDGTSVEGGMTHAEWLAWYDEVFPTLVEALKESGACWARVRIDWNTIEPGPSGQRDYTWFDSKLGDVADAGLQMIAVIDDVPEWARGEPYGEPYPGYSCTHVAEDLDPPDEFAAFLTDLVNRYKEPPWNIHVWEFRNEPDGIDPVELDPMGLGCGGERADLYVDNLQRAYQAIKDADPTATVLMGGLAYDRFTEWGGPFNRYFPDDVMANGGAGYMDALNVHYFPDFHEEWERWVWYPGYLQAIPPTCGDVEKPEDGGAPYEAWGIDVIAKVKHLRNRMDTCFDVQKPVWVTELGEHGDAAIPGSLEQQARYVIQGQVRALAAGAEKISWYALVVPADDPFHQGLLYDDMTPKPAYFTYQTLTKELGGYEYSYTRDVTNVEAYVFVDSLGREKTVAWASGEPGEQAFLTFDSSGPLRIIDHREEDPIYVYDGGPGDADGSQNGSIRLQLPAVPVDPDPDNPPRLTAEPLFISR